MLSIGRAAVFGILALWFLLAGCSSQGTSSKNNSPEQVGACDIDAKAVCQSMRNRPVINSRTGIATNNNYREQNSSRTASEFTRFTLPSGNPVVLECYINTQNSAVVYAKSSLRKELSAADADFLRARGMCAQ